MAQVSNFFQAAPATQVKSILVSFCAHWQHVTRSSAQITVGTTSGMPGVPTPPGNRPTYATLPPVSNHLSATPLGPIHTGRGHNTCANSNIFSFMLLACSVVTPIHINRPHWLASHCALRVASRVLCGLGLMGPAVCDVVRCKYRPAPLVLTTLGRARSPSPLRV